MNQLIALRNLVLVTVVLSVAGMPAALAAAEGLRAANSHPVEVVTATQAVEGGALKPVALVAPRGGLATGQVALGGGIGGATAAVEAFKGPGTIPTGAVAARFAVTLGKGERSWPMYLADVAPAQASGGLIISVEVPADAKPGVYTGSLVVAKGGAKTTIPLALTVADWLRTPPAKQVVRFDLNSAQESIAKAYSVPMWSEQHWALMERSLSMCAKYGSRTLFVPAIACGVNGLTESMLRYARAGGVWKVDTSRLDRYLALQMKTGVTPDVIQFFVSSQHNGGDVHPSRGTEAELPGVKPFRVTGVDGKPLEVKNFTPDAEAFFNAAFGAAYASLKKAGIPASALVAGGQEEWGPSKFFVEQVKKAAPDAGWYLAAHDNHREIQGVKVAYAAIVRGIDFRGDGWLNPQLCTNYDYDNGPSQGPARNYGLVMQAIGGKKRGVGHISADWWGAGDYLWTGGQPTMMNWGQFIFQKGKAGAEHTVSSLLYLESLQDTEAIVTILAAAKAGKAGDSKVANEMMTRSAGPFRAPRYDYVGGAKGWVPETLPELQLRLYTAAGQAAGHASDR